MVDVDQLTNEEIRDQLMRHGCDPGPVVGSTRNVYANKLRRLLEGSDVAVLSERTASDAAGAGNLKSTPKRGDVSNSSQKSRSPRRATRSSAQEISSLSKVQNIPLNSKISPASVKAADVSSVNSHIISDSKQLSPKSYIVQPSVPVLPKSRVELEFETRTEVNTVPESNRSPSRASVTSESASLDVISNSFKKSTVPESNRSPSRASITSETASLDVISSSFKKSKPFPFETVPKVYRTTPTTRFTSLRDNWENGKISDGSDDDLRGEESSRILLPSWKEDHTYSVRYDSKQNPATRRSLDENSTAHYSQTSHYNSAVFENSYNGYGNRRSGLVDKEKTSRSYGKIGLSFLFIITTIIFVFFVVQNYVELERGEGNKEEF
ncbi:LEM domain family protein [Acanthocheilonema viteae]